MRDGFRSLRAANAEELLEYSSNLRRLARSLVRDDATVRDLVQDAFWVSWSLASEAGPGKGGKFQVVAGETRSVEVDVRSAGTTFSTVIHIEDASGGQDVGKAWIWVSDPTNSGPSFQVHAERAAERGPDAWALRLDDLAARRWTVTLGQHGSTIRFAPRTIEIGPGAVPPIVSAHEIVLASVAVTVKHAVTREALPFAEVSYWIGSGGGTSPGRAPTGELTDLRLPRDEVTNIFGWAPGHRMARAQHMPARDGDSLVIELHDSGWATCVRV